MGAALEGGTMGNKARKLIGKEVAWIGEKYYLGAYFSTQARRGWGFGLGVAIDQWQVVHEG